MTDTLKMNEYDISIVINSHEKYQTSPLLNMLGIGLSSNRDKPLVDVYHITEDRYKLTDNYKVGLTANMFTGSPSRTPYIHDLLSKLRADINNNPGVCGVYYREYIGEKGHSEIVKEGCIGQLLELHPLEIKKGDYNKVIEMYTVKGVRILVRVVEKNYILWSRKTIETINQDITQDKIDIFSKFKVYRLHPMITVTNDKDIESKEKKWVSVADFMKTVNTHGSDTNCDIEKEVTT